MSVAQKGFEQPNIQVIRAAQNLPQTATATLFTVSGLVLVKSMFGLVTTALGATVTSLSLGTTPTGGASAPASIATSAVVTSAALGNLFVPAFASGIATAPIQAGVVVLAQSPILPFVVTGGVITWTTTAGNTGQMKWYLQYLAIDPGATVT